MVSFCPIVIQKSQILYRLRFFVFFENLKNFLILLLYTLEECLTITFSEMDSYLGVFSSQGAQKVVKVKIFTCEIGCKVQNHPKIPLFRKVWSNFKEP